MVATAATAAIKQFSDHEVCSGGSGTRFRVRGPSSGRVRDERLGVNTGQGVSVSDVDKFSISDYSTGELHEWPQ